MVKTTTAAETDVGKHLDNVTGSNCWKLLKQASGVEDKIDLLALKKGELYDNVLVVLENAGIPWKNKFAELQRTANPEWPKEGSVPIGLNKVVAVYPDYLPGKILNRFGSYCSKFTDYNTKRMAPPPKQKLADLPPEERTKAYVEEAKARTEKIVASTAHAINFDLVVKSLRELLTFAQRINNAKAAAQVIALAESFGIHKDAVFVVHEVVITPKGDVLMPEEPKKGETQAATK